MRNNKVWDLKVQRRRVGGTDGGQIRLRETVPGQIVGRRPLRIGSPFLSGVSSGAPEGLAPQGAQGAALLRPHGADPPGSPPCPRLAGHIDSCQSTPALPASHLALEPQHPQRPGVARMRSTPADGQRASVAGPGSARREAPTARELGRASTAGGLSAAAPVGVPVVVVAVAGPPVPEGVATAPPDAAEAPLQCSQAASSASAALPAASEEPRLPQLPEQGPQPEACALVGDEAAGSLLPRKDLSEPLAQIRDVCASLSSALHDAADMTPDPGPWTAKRDSDSAASGLGVDVPAAGRQTDAECWKQLHEQIASLRHRVKVLADYSSVPSPAASPDKASSKVALAGGSPSALKTTALAPKAPIAEESSSLMDARVSDGSACREAPQSEAECWEPEGSSASTAEHVTRSDAASRACRAPGGAPDAAQTSRALQGERPMARKATAASAPAPPGGQHDRRPMSPTRLAAERPSPAWARGHPAPQPHGATRGAVEASRAQHLTQLAAFAAHIAKLGDVLQPAPSAQAKSPVAVVAPQPVARAPRPHSTGSVARPRCGAASPPAAPAGRSPHVALHAASSGLPGRQSVAMPSSPGLARLSEWRGPPETERWRGAPADLAALGLSAFPLVPLHRVTAQAGRAMPQPGGAVVSIGAWPRGGAHTVPPPGRHCHVGPG